MDNGNSVKERMLVMLNDIVGSSEKIWIYGAGIVGKRLLHVLETYFPKKTIAGFVVSEKPANDKLNGYPMICIKDHIVDYNAVILIAVRDVYREEIVSILKQQGYWNFYDAHGFSFLEEKQLPEVFLKEIPKELEISIAELMLQQYAGNSFIRYDLIDMMSREIELNSEFICPIIVNGELRISDSIEELAKAIKNGKDTVRILIKEDVEIKVCDEQWLETYLEPEYGKKVHLLKDIYMRQWEQPIVGILWPPAEKIFDAITNDIGSMYTIQSIKEYKFSKDELTQFIYEVYGTDDIEKWKIEKKIERLLQEKEYKVRVLKIYIQNPEFRVKKYGHTISKAVVELKTNIRNKYNTQIYDYLGDIIIHIADNFKQSNKIAEILERQYK